MMMIMMVVVVTITSRNNNNNKINYSVIYFYVLKQELQFRSQTAHSKYWFQH
jgi:hypothetical protein